MVQLCKGVVKDARAATPGRPGTLLRLHPQSDRQWFNCLKGFRAGAARLLWQSTAPQLTGLDMTST